MLLSGTRGAIGRCCCVVEDKFKKEIGQEMCGLSEGQSKKQNMYLVLGAKGISRVERKWKNGATCVTAVESFMYGLYPKEMLWLYEAGTGRQEGRSEWQSEVM